MENGADGTDAYDACIAEHTEHFSETLHIQAGMIMYVTCLLDTSHFRAENDVYECCQFKDWLRQSYGTQQW